MKYYECLTIPKSDRENPSEWLNGKITEGKTFMGFVADQNGHHTKALMLVDTEAPDVVIAVDRNMAMFVAMEFHLFCAKNAVPEHKLAQEFTTWWLDNGKLISKLRGK